MIGSKTNKAIFKESFTKVSVKMYCTTLLPNIFQANSTFKVFQRLLIMRHSEHWIWILITIHVNTETIRVHASTGSRHYRRFGGGSALDVRNLPPFAIMTGRVSAHGCCIMSRSRRLIELYARITRTW